MLGAPRLVENWPSTRRRATSAQAAAPPSHGAPPRQLKKAQRTPAGSSLLHHLICLRQQHGRHPDVYGMRRILVESEPERVHFLYWKLGGACALEDAINYEPARHHVTVRSKP